MANKHLEGCITRKTQIKTRNSRDTAGIGCLPRIHRICIQSHYRGVGGEGGGERRGRKKIHSY